MQSPKATQETAASQVPPAIAPEEVWHAMRRIRDHIVRTPLFYSKLLDSWLGGHRIYFKCENFQKVGAFKARGAINTLLAEQERGALPEKVVAFSLGNHSGGAAWACRRLGVPARIYLQKGVTPLKRQATESYGPEVIVTQSRQEAMARVEEDVKKGYYFIHPYDHDDIIAGQGTCALEIIEDLPDVDAIFAPIGGGGLASGSLLATRLMRKDCKVFGVEPKRANDAARSVKAGHIIGYDTPPDTVADGVRTLAMTERTFQYIRQLDGIYEVEEEDILYWTQWVAHLIKITAEPSSAMVLGAAFDWLKTQSKPRTVALIVSGGNVDAETHRLIWAENHLDITPASRLENNW
jgi:threonine dehydratase